MLHGKKVHLVFKAVIQLRGIHLQGLVHEHIVIPSVCALAAPDDKLVLILSEIQAAYNAV